MDTTKVTRVEVIDHTKSLDEGGGRAYVYWKDQTPEGQSEKIKVELSLQDNGRTLKVFITSHTH